ASYPSRAFSFTVRRPISTHNSKVTCVHPLQ
uniref:Uncharacterized protein n=1 Tax=Amphimedon queenslandica TaxID=400682 RepID=A0A1X7SVD0_AMPQE